MQVNELDFAIRKKNKEAALKNYAATKSALDAVIAKLG